MFSNIRQDLAVYQGDWGSQGFWAMLVYRFGRWRYGFKMAVIRKPLSLIYKLLYKMVQIVTGIELPCEVPVGVPGSKPTPLPPRAFLTHRGLPVRSKAAIPWALAAPSS